jgi:MFS transporter, DHA3 family, macrolide efflux protein
MYKISAQGMRIFNLVWLGQVVSTIGSGLTDFSLGIWVVQHTGSVTLFAVVLLCATLPNSLISPLAGIVVDRWPRRWIMIFGDLGAGISSLLLAILLVTDRLATWNICLALAISSMFRAFQVPAYSAATTLLVPSEHLDRANGMVQLGQAMSQLVSPILGGILIVSIHLEGIFLVDFVSFLIAIIPLLLLRFPEVRVDAGRKDRNFSLLHEASFGLAFIVARPGLLGLLVFLTLSNFLVGAVGVLFTPLILTLSSPTTLGLIQSIGGIGALLSSLLLSTRGGPRRLMHGVFGFQLLGGLCFLVVGFYDSIPLITVATFLFYFGWPIVNSCTQTIFQRTVEPDVQGKVFAARQMISDLSFPIAYVISGPLADKVFEPMMAANGILSGNIGKIIGIGTGRGIGLMFIMMGAFTILSTAIAYQYPSLRLVEDQLSDARV